MLGLTLSSSGLSRSSGSGLSMVKPVTMPFCDLDVGPAARREQRVVGLLVGHLRRIQARLQAVDDDLARCRWDAIRAWRRTPCASSLRGSNRRGTGPGRSGRIRPGRARRCRWDRCCRPRRCRTASSRRWDRDCGSSRRRCRRCRCGPCARRRPRRAARRRCRRRRCCCRRAENFCPLSSDIWLRSPSRRTIACWPCLIERTGRAQVHQAADGAFGERGLRALDDVGAADDIGGQHVVGEIAAGTIGREDAAIEGGQGVFGPEAAHADLLAFAARGARDRHAGDVAERVGDVVVGEFAEFQCADGILHGARVRA